MHGNGAGLFPTVDQIWNPTKAVAQEQGEPAAPLSSDAANGQQKAIAAIVPIVIVLGVIWILERHRISMAARASA